MRKLTAASPLLCLLACSKEKNETVAEPKLSGTIVFREESNGLPSFAAINTFDVETGTLSKIMLPEPTPGFKINYDVPKLSFDGKKIVFCSNMDGDANDYDIYIMNIDGSNVQKLTNNPARDEFSVSLSPDGTKLLYIAKDGQGNNQIFTANANGSNEQQLTHFTHPTREVWNNLPQWSKDGSRIVFISNKDTTHMNIYSINPDGSGLKTIATNNTQSEYLTSISPDGRKLLYYTFVGNAQELFSMNIDGTNKVQLTSFGGLTGDAAWSPDGNFIAFTSNKDQASNRSLNLDYYIMKKDGTAVQRITSTDTWKVWADWK